MVTSAVRRSRAINHFSHPSFYFGKFYVSLSLCNLASTNFFGDMSFNLSNDCVDDNSNVNFLSCCDFCQSLPTLQLSS